VRSITPSRRYAGFIVPLLGAGGLILALGLAEPRQPSAGRPAALQPKSDGVRLIYPTGRLPTIALPNGERREIKSLLNVERPLRFGDYIWNEADVPAGAVWVRVDLERQTMSVFRGGHEIGAAVILYGTDGKATPTGVFPVIEKAAYHRSSSYDAYMPYMLRLTGDGVAVHASRVRQGSATHGCVGIPSVFAKLLFDQIKRGDDVFIT
jgi:hypothetical protein